MSTRNLLKASLLAVVVMFSAAGCGDNDNGDDYDYEIEGVITGIISQESFLINNIVVTHSPSTRFEYGTVADLATGRRIEVEGTRTSSETIIAYKIEFEDYDDYENYDRDFEIEGVITSIIDSDSFMINSFLVTHNSSTRFEYGTAADLAAGRRIEVEGTRTSSETIIAYKIEFEDYDY